MVSFFFSSICYKVHEESFFLIFLAFRWSIDKESAGFPLSIYYTLSPCLCFHVPKLFVCVPLYACPHVSCFANRGEICFLCVCVYSSANRECVFFSLLPVCMHVCVWANKVVIKPKSTTLQWGGFRGDSSLQRHRLHLLLQSFLIWRICLSIFVINCTQYVPGASTNENCN